MKLRKFVLLSNKILFYYTNHFKLKLQSKCLIIEICIMRIICKFLLILWFPIEYKEKVSLLFIKQFIQNIVKNTIMIYNNMFDSKMELTGFNTHAKALGFIL